jgi:VWFA-related protein
MMGYVGSGFSRTFQLLGARIAVAGVTAILAASIAWPVIAQDQPPTFRVGQTTVSVDVVVRDGSGAIVRGLTAADFTVLEDGKPQKIDAFTFQEIHDTPPKPLESTALLAGVEERLREEVQRVAGVAPAATAPAAEPTVDLSGRRLLVLLFDISSMQPEEVQRAVDSATKYASSSMAASDLVSVVTIGSTLTVLSDFTDQREEVLGALQSLAYSDGTAVPPVALSTVATDEAAAEADPEAATDEGFEAFNNDVRLRALKTLADTLAPIEQKKAILYFSAGMTRSGEDNQVELRSAINAAVRGNVAIYPVDSRGLQAVVPGGDASRASGRGVGLFSGQNVARQFQQLTASQGTLTTLAADTGGRAFTDTNDFGAAFARVQRDLSAYYLLGYSSTNPSKDGRFRRIQVRVNRRNVRLEARAGYYADRNFANTNRRDREAQLEEQLTAAVSSTDVPLIVGTGAFRQTPDRFHIPIAVAIPGSAIPVPEGSTKVTIDVRGLILDEQGRSVGRLRATMEIPSGGGSTLAGKQVLYQSDVLLPPGRFSVKVVVRENASGAIGSFETPILVPQLRDQQMKVSSVVLSTQLQPAPANRAGSPLVRDGQQLLPNLTRVVNRGQNIYFYYEVYDPALMEQMPDLRTSLAFYRGDVKVFETPLVERAVVDDAQRRAVVFQFQVPASQFTPGTYTCQVNIIDAVANRMAFPRLSFMVRAQDRAAP